jgi:hypothetical protein
MAQAAKHERLKQAFDTHRPQTEGQIQRLQQVFSLLDLKAEGAPCEAIQGILAEGSEVGEVCGAGRGTRGDLRPLPAGIYHVNETVPREQWIYLGSGVLRC